MKKIFVATAAFLLLSVISYAQYSLTSSKTSSTSNAATGISELKRLADPDSVPQTDYEKYMEKSRNQKTLSFLIAGVGAIVLIAGLASFPKENAIFGSSENVKKTDQATITTIIGAGLMCASIPFTIFSGLNKRKAKLALKKQQTGFGLPINRKCITGLAINIAI